MPCDTVIGKPGLLYCGESNLANGSSFLWYCLEGSRNHGRHRLQQLYAIIARLDLALKVLPLLCQH